MDSSFFTALFLFFIDQKYNVIGRPIRKIIES